MFIFSHPMPIVRGHRYLPRYLPQVPQVPINRQLPLLPLLPLARYFFLFLENHGDILTKFLRIKKNYLYIPIQIQIFTLSRFRILQMMLNQIFITVFSVLTGLIIVALFLYIFSVILFVLYGGSVGGLIFLHCEYGSQAIKEILEQVGTVPT